MTRLIKVFDWRKEKNWEEKLALLSDKQLLSEGKRQLAFPSSDRFSLRETDNLVICTPLSSPDEWIKVLKQAAPKNVYLLFGEGKSWQAVCLLSEILGMLKAKEEKGSCFFVLEGMAVRLNVSLHLLRTALDYLSSSGFLYYQKQSSYWQFTLLTAEKSREDLYLKKKLYRLLMEREAFLRYQRQARLSSLQKAINSWYQRKNMLK